MKPILVIRQGEPEGASLDLAPGSHLVGRSSQCALQLKARDVSRVHLVFSVEGQSVTVENRSQFGALLDGQPLQTPTPIRPGARIQAGKETILELIDADAAHMAADDVTLLAQDPNVPEPSTPQPHDPTPTPLPEPVAQAQPEPRPHDQTPQPQTPAPLPPRRPADPAPEPGPPAPPAPSEDLEDFASGFIDLQADSRAGEDFVFESREAALDGVLERKGNTVFSRRSSFSGGDGMQRIADLADADKDGHTREMGLGAVAYLREVQIRRERTRRILLWLLAALVLAGAVAAILWFLRP